MNLTNTMRVIGRHKVLLVLGILVAIAAAFSTAFRVETGTLTPRAETTYRATTQLLVSDPTSVFATKPPSTVVGENEIPSTARDLSSLTIVYAYLVSSDAVRDQVEAELGPLADNEKLTSAQRTTQPTVETNTGTYRLPILEVAGESTDPDRAIAIASAATDAFLAEVAATQQAAGVLPENRVTVEAIRTTGPNAISGSNPALPVVAVAVGVLLAFLALMFIADNARTTRREAREQRLLAEQRAVRDREYRDALPPQDALVERDRSYAETTAQR